MGDSRTHCETFQTDDGKPITVKKKKYDTLESASYEAKKLNARPKQKITLVPYQCTVCNKFHLGRNGTELKASYKKRLIGELKAEEFEKKHAMPKFKIIGKIDLNKFNYKSRFANDKKKVK